MNKTLPKATLIVGAMFCTAAFAVDLDNSDHQSYSVVIHDGASTQRSSINSMTTQKGVCSKCEVEVVGLGSVKASGSVTVKIKNGKLSVG